MKRNNIMKIDTSDKKWVLYSLCLWIVLAGCSEVPRGEREGNAIELPPYVYLRYLTYPVPSAGIEAEFNPPALRWPLAKGKSVKYDVRMASDSLFTRDVISVDGTPWAMFNAHKKLQPGEWFWQYRVSGQQWSGVQRFVISGTAVDLVSPSVAELLAGIPEGHPRVLADRSEIPRLRGLTDNEDARHILEEAEQALRGRIYRERDGQPQRTEQDSDRAKKLRQDASNRLGANVYDAVRRLCEAWVLSGNIRFQQRAIAIAEEVSGWDPNGVTSSRTSDFADARCMLSMALVFDTFHDELTTRQRSALVEAIGTRADGFYQSWINNQEARVLSGHVWQHILHYFFETSIALYSHDARATNWLGFAYELFLARTPILGGTDGGWVEGVSYFRMNMETVVEIPLFIRKFTGYDFIKAHPWYERNIDWLVYNIPPGSSSDGFGDNSEEVFSPGAEYIAYAKAIASLTGNSLAAWYAQACMRYESPNLSATRLLRWARLTAVPGSSELSEAVGTPTLASGKLFSDIGLVAMHSHPENTESNLMVAVRSSPFGCYGHYLADQNAFNIVYGGERTFFRTGYKVTMSDPHRTGWYQHTKSNNSVLVDDEGQPYSTEAYGWIPKFVAGDQIVYALADGSQAYASEETGEDRGVEQFNRHILLLKPDIVVIYDELEASRPVTWSWLIHAMSRIETDSATNTFRSSFEKSVGVGRLWSSAATRFVLRDTFDVPAINWRGSKDQHGKLKSYEEDQWHLRAVTSERTPQARFLAVLQVSPSAKLENIVPIMNADSSLQISTGGWTISSNLASAKTSSLRIVSADESTIFELRDGIIKLIEDGQEKGDNQVFVPWQLEQSARALGSIN